MWPDRVSNPGPLTYESGVPKRGLLLQKRLCSKVNTEKEANNEKGSAASPKSAPIHPLYTSRLFHCYMLDESSCHFRGVGSILLLLFYF